MKLKKSVILFLMIVLAALMVVGCNKGKKTGGGSGEIKEFTAFFAVPGNEINDDNVVQKAIAENRCQSKETWLTGQTAEESVGVIIAGEEYPDFIDGAVCNSYTKLML